MADRQKAFRNLRRGSDRRLLTEEQAAQARELWPTHTAAEVAQAIGVGVDLLRARLADQLSDLERRGRGGRPPNRNGPGLFEPMVDPTPDEIRIRAAEVRKSWGPERFLPDYVPEDRRYGRAIGQ